MEWIGRIGTVITAANRISQNITNATSATSPTSNANSPTIVKPRPQVIEINSRSGIEEVTRYPIKSREKCLIFHGEIDPLSFPNSKVYKYNVILHVPGSEKMFSLFRSDSKQEAEYIFGIYKRTFPELVSVDLSFCVKDKLEKICAKLKENQGWSAIHIASAFDYIHIIRDPIFAKYLNEQENELLRTPLHIAILHKNINAVTALLELEVQIDINDIKENTVLHFAAQSSSQILQLLFDQYPGEMFSIIDFENREGVTALHFASLNDTQSVMILLRKNANSDIMSKLDGNYPIHHAVKSRSMTAIKEMVELNEKCLIHKDLETGGTPLHWATNWEIIEKLIDLGSDPNAINNENNTPLHLAAERGCLKSTLILLSSSAFANFKGVNGNTPLHIASIYGFKSIIQVLIAFGADVNMTNDDGHTSRHLVCVNRLPDSDICLFYLSSVGAERCAESKKILCKEGCVFSIKKGFEGIPPEKFPKLDNINILHEALHAFSLNNQGQKYDEQNANSPYNSGDSHIGGRLLCLDGGGVRGIVLIQMLLVLEQEIGVPIVDLFDWIAGTSTGGILALGLATGKSILEMQGLYLRLKDKAFVGERPYSSDTFEEFLKKEFGCDKKMRSIRRPRVMISSLVVDCRPVEFHFFRNYISPKSIIEPPVKEDEDDIHIWEAAKYTGAAPSYFRLGGSKYIDGGLIGNNPTLDALTELQQFNASLRAVGSSRNSSTQVPSIVLSLGTGIPPQSSCSTSNIDITWPKNIFDAYEKANKLYSLVNLLVDQATQSEGQVVERSRAWCAAIGVPFYRFSPQLTKNVDLDEKNDEVLVNLMWETRVFMLSQMEAIQEIKQILLKK